MASPASAQVNSSTPGWFPFSIPGYDAAPTPIDLSSLNAKPAGKDGFLRVRDGMIQDGAGRRVRLFGFNFPGEASFPPKADAPRIAARLAKLGVNIIRLHHMDYTWSPGSLMNYPANDAIRADNLDRLDFFVAELKKQGIYVNLNLHVSRTYPGTPEAFDFSKGLDQFYPPYVERFKRYARDLITHRNPYTGSTYAEEPAVAVIEVNNENTLGMFSPIRIASLPEPFAGELKKQWIAWLKARYGTTEKLRAAWGVNDGSVGPNLVPNASFASDARGWVLENHNGAQSTLARLPDGTPGIRWTVTKRGTENWHLQLNHPGLNLVEGGSYRCAFRARADASRSFGASVMLDQAPWSGCGLSEGQSLTTAWRKFSYDFVATGTVPNHVRINFSAENRVGVFDIAGVSLQSISSGALKPDETFEKNDLPFTASSPNGTARRDFVRFLIETERNHAAAMHRYIQQELGARSLVYHSQTVFGGMAGSLREKTVSDLADTHSYWQHPNFPGTPWDPVNWNIPNTSQLSEASGGVLAEMALQRPQGMPFTVSEYNNPAPSDFSAETWPGLATIASLQDWDGLYFFDYLSFTNDYNGDKIRSFFTAQGHPAQMAFTPFAALLFRGELVAPAQKTVLLTASEARILDDQTSRGMWGSFGRFWEQAGLSPAVALQHKTALAFVPGDAPTTASFRPSLATQAVSDTGEITWDAARQRLTVNAPAVRLLMGQVGGQTISAGDVRFTIASLGGNEHAHLGLIALDRQPLGESRKLLLVALGRAENQNMGWNASRTSVGNRWGSGPAVVQGVRGTVTLPRGGWQVDALDPTGAPRQRLASDTQTVNLDPADKTVWYLLQR